MDDDARRRFVDAWGSMGALWGINRSVARVHALLMASDAPLTLDEIAERLEISKGNASMSLRELRTFGVVRPVQVPGDRRDWYVSEPDVWTMFFRILAERKRRELDPAVAAVRAVLSESGSGGRAHARFRQMADLLDSLEAVAGQVLRSPEAARSTLQVIARVSRVSSPRRAKKR
jgi:DNA-binding transcriptional regulator GbsR (MarR family)